MVEKLICKIELQEGLLVFLFSSTEKNKTKKKWEKVSSISHAHADHVINTDIQHLNDLYQDPPSPETTLDILTGIRARFLVLGFSEDNFFLLLRMLEIERNSPIEFHLSDDQDDKPPVNNICITQ